MKKDDAIYLEHINAALAKIQEYTLDHNLESFLGSDITQDAVMRQLEIVGEATKRLSQTCKLKYPMGRHGRNA